MYDDDPVVNDTIRYYAQLDREARREAAIAERQNLLIDDRSEFDGIVDSVVGSMWWIPELTEEINDWLMQNLICPALAGGKDAQHISETLCDHIKKHMWEHAETDYDTLRKPR